MARRKRILFLYPYMEESRPYVQALRDQGFDVQALTSVDEALSCIENKHEYDLLIWTMWFEEPGERIRALGEARHGGGTKTGECFVEIARRHYPSTLMLLFTRDRMLIRPYSRPREAHYAWNFSVSNARIFAHEVYRLLHGAIDNSKP